MMEATRQGLADTLVRLRGRIEQIRSRGESIGEQNTKAVLVDPLLSALGWDLEELSEVRREYRHKPQDNPVDYALFILRAPCLFVEAKDLSKDLRDWKWVTQILGYATVVGVEWCVLTNGDEYRLYNAHAPVDAEQKLFRVARISDSTQHEYAFETLDLLSRGKMGEKLIDVLWKAHFVDRQVKTAIDSLFSSENKTLISWIRKKTGLPRSEVRESLRRADVRVDFPMMVGGQQVSAQDQQSEDDQAEEPPGRVRVIHLIEEGLIHPPLELEREYKGVHLTATIQQDGSIVFDGESYNSLSAAGGFARNSVIGAPREKPYHQTNGWTFWRYRDPETGNLQEIDALRQQYRKSH